MERSQYDHSLRYTACSTSYISPERDSSTSSSNDSIYTGGVRNCPDQKRLQLKSADLSAQQPGCTFGSAGERDKAGVRRSSIQPYPHSSTAMQPQFLQQPGPMVQMDNRLTEEHPRRIHCYISQVESEDTTPSDHAPPPLLPPLETLDTAQDIPFWRPPRVLQREPHYNYLMTPQSAGTCGSQLSSALPPRRQGLQPPQREESVARYTYCRDGNDDLSTSDIAEASTSHLSPALLAISNSHYQQQKRQERQAASAAYSAPRSSKPTIQSLLSATVPSPDTQAGNTCQGASKSSMHVYSKDCNSDVAQKSYGGEKRFLCPPPAVLMYGEGYSARTAHHSPMVLSVITDSAVADKAVPAGHLKGSASRASEGSADAATSRASASAHAPLECQTSFNERNVALFKSLHVTGMQKAKSFRLRLDLITPPGISGQLAGHDQSMWQSPKPYVSLQSNSVAIISKPSKKTAKARNQSSCIREGSLISLFNRINSQTFRTKYLNVEHNTNRWVAQSHNWSPLEVVVTSSKSSRAAGGQADAANPLYYGSEIVLVESRRNFRSPKMIIHKVERGRLVENACSPVSQMQKIALQVKPTAPGDAPRYLKADVGHYSPTNSDANTPAQFDDPDGSPELTFEPLDNARLSRARSREHVSDGGIELDDAFCWTIVGISGFTYAYTVPVEQPVKHNNVGPIPRIEEAELKTGMVLSLRLADFDCPHMQLLLNGQPLDLKLCSTAKATENGLLSSRFTTQLPADATSGALCIRRADGVMYHTKWALQQLEGESKEFELVACNLDI
ncbi:hypothetical protein EV183_003873 [Coemansia sp. RSA 2336]|nr:hypothetical protein EV183_003873 [Coemansia sp. RSA 2336]